MQHQGLFTLGQAFHQPDTVYLHWHRHSLYQLVRVYLHWDRPSINVSGFVYTGTGLPSTCPGLFTLGQAFHPFGCRSC